MRFPWQQRADTERERREHAETRLHRTRADWAPVLHGVAQVRRERELNGWTATLKTIFEGDK